MSLPVRKEEHQDKDQKVVWPWISLSYPSTYSAQTSAQHLGHATAPEVNDRANTGYVNTFCCGVIFIWGLENSMSAQSFHVEPL